MATISFSGLGSGLDINGLVTSLVDAERVPKTNRLDFKEAELQAKLTAFGTLKSSLSSFQSTLSTLKSMSTFQGADVLSNDDKVFTATSNGQVSDGDYQIEVTSLAQSHALSSSGFSSATDVVGTGTLTFSFGTFSGGSFTVNADKATKTVTIDSSKNTLEGIRDAVNAADIGVNAVIINTGSTDGVPYKLVFTSKDTGAANSLKITVSEDGSSPTNTDTSGLSQLAYDPEATAGSGKNMTETSAAADADFKINGLQVLRASNSISDVIDGVTIDLLADSAGKSVGLTVRNNTAVATNSVNNFISAYNELMDTINSLSDYDTETEQGGVLLGDFAVRNAETRIRQELSNIIGEISGEYNSLASIGISTDKDGKLELDSTRLDAALKSGVDVVGRIFAATGTPSDSQIKYTSSTSDTQVGTYAVNVTQLATRGILTGADFGYSGSITIDSNNDTFSIQVDGVQSGTITLGAGTYTGAQLAAELQSRINGDSALQDKGVSVSVGFNSSNQFEITSNRYGSASKVQITSVDTSTQSTLGLSAVAGTAGQDVVGTINGQPATGSGQYLTGSGVAVGLKIQVLGTATGSRGSVAFTRGVADRLDSVITELLKSDGTIESKIDGLEAGVDDIGRQREELDARIQKIEERYRAQFIALDALVAQFQATGNYLTEQLANIPKIQANKK